MCCWSNFKFEWGAPKGKQIWQRNTCKRPDYFKNSYYEKARSLKEGVLSSVAH